MAKDLRMLSLGKCRVRRNTTVFFTQGGEPRCTLPARGRLSEKLEPPQVKGIPDRKILARE